MMHDGQRREQILHHPPHPAVVRYAASSHAPGVVFPRPLRWSPITVRNCPTSGVASVNGSVQNCSPVIAGKLGLRAYA